MKTLDLAFSVKQMISLRDLFLSVSRLQLIRIKVIIFTLLIIYYGSIQVVYKEKVFTSYSVLSNQYH